MDWSWSQCIKSHHAQTSSGKGLPSHFWTRDNVRSVLPGLWRKRTGLLLSGPKSSFQMKVNFAFHLEIKVPESGGRVESGEAQNPCCLKSSVKFPQSVMIWAAMSSAGVGPLCFLKSTVNTAIYQEILEHFMLEVFTEDPRPENRPGTRTGSGLYFKWSAGSGSGPNLLLRVPGLFNIPESIGEHHTREWSVSVSSMYVFCNLQFVKLGWEKCERKIRWKKNKRYLSRQKQSAGGVNVSTASGRWSWIPAWVIWKKSWNKTEETHLLLNTHAVKCNELLILCVFC